MKPLRLSWPLWAAGLPLLVGGLSAAGLGTLGCTADGVKPMGCTNDNECFKPYVCNAQVGTCAPPPKYADVTVRKLGDGGGSITSLPAGLSCDASCAMATGKFQVGVPVTLTAAPGAGSSFVGYSSAATAPPPPASSP